MKIKKFTASSMPEAMKQIRLELGNEAVILNSKVVQSNGIMGFFRKSIIEVIAATDQTTDIQAAKSKTQIKQKKKPSFTEHSQTTAQISNQRLETKLTNTNNQELLKEIRELKTIISDVSSGFPSSIENLPEPIRKVNKLLIQQEVSTSVRKDILAALYDKWNSQQQRVSDKDCFQWMKSGLHDMISNVEYGGITFTKKYINVVGPTGVGKTTTLAKIAAECMLTHQKKVAFITTDTFRIAAIEQLKTYAKILNVPIEVAYNSEDFNRAKEKFNEYDLVLIDTAGRNYRNPKYISDLQEIFDFNDEMETYLVLSLTSKMSDMEAIHDQFSLFNINKIIFTKVDETTVYGPLINLISQKGVGVAYLTTGQNVPDDIVIASPSMIVDTVVGEGLK